MPRAWKSLIVGLVGVALLSSAQYAGAEPLGLSADPGHAHGDDGSGGASQYKPSISTVTLITGDRVRITTLPNGTRSVIPMPGAGRAANPVSIRYRGDAIDVVPADAGTFVRAGRLDPRLFDVAGLVAAGYDDASSPELPLLARHAPGRSALEGAPAGATVGRTSDGDSSTALGLRKKDAASFWKWLVGSQQPEPAASRSTGDALAAGIQEISLRSPTSTHHAGAGTMHMSSDATPARKAAPPGANATTADLLIKLIDRNGRLITKVDEAFFTEPVVLNRDTEDVYPLEPRPAGLGVALPPGSYSFGEIIVTTQRLQPTSYTLLARPNFTVSGNLTLTLDARQAHEIRATAQAPDPTPIVTTFGVIELFAGRPWTTLVTLPGATPFRAFALQTAAVTDRPYNFAMFQSSNSSWGIYDLLVGESGAVPANPTYHLRNADLGRISSRFNAAGTGLGLKGTLFREAQLPGDVQVGLGWFYPTGIPSTRVRFTSSAYGGDPLPWFASVDVGRDPAAPIYSEVRAPSVLPIGQTTLGLWNPATFRPEGHGVRRDDLSMNVTFQPFASGDVGTTFFILDEAGMTGSAVLERRGEPVARVNAPNFLRTEPQPAATTSYSLDLLARRNVSWARYGTSIHAYWKFTCHRPPTGHDGHPMRLLNIGINGDFDLYGRAPAGRPFRLDLTVPEVEGTGRPESAVVAVSFDEGKTWNNVPTVRDATRKWHVIINHPNTPGRFVALRAKTQTDHGDVYSMTTIRAYGIGPAPQ